MSVSVADAKAKAKAKVLNEICNEVVEQIRPGAKAVSYTHLTLPTICSV